MTLTPGQEALREAARLEAARVYGGVCAEHKQPRSIVAARAEAEINAWHVDNDDIEKAIRSGLATSQIIERYGATYAEVRTIRKQLMKEGAA